MFTAKRIATALFVGSTLIAMPLAGGAAASNPCHSDGWCYYPPGSPNDGYQGNCSYAAGCGCTCYDGYHDCEGAGTGYCDIFITPSS